MGGGGAWTEEGTFLSGSLLLPPPLRPSQGNRDRSECEESALGFKEGTPRA